ncbi:DNA alkylation repair protein [Sulfitobacter sp. D35]|uniref:DNA alkylation repair protein n=1 Tax=Sulfitobacter sp. D35 TaxID=3083252 RepID=UPI00296F790E|nr:DNA alkylation repair protein [Sulfitobacter sp. D35]MDW4496920.1 DNA alkylation repair protein [Sulfitobacter sp. D35]
MHEAALAELESLADPARGAQMRAYHKADRTYLGLSNEDINRLSTAWRRAMDTETRVAVADGLWRTDIHEARVAAAKLLTQARIRDDAPVWTLIRSWVPQFDAWAIADHACKAGEKRLVADTDRLDVVESWTGSDHLWMKRAVLVITLPWTKQNFPSPDDLAIRDRVLGWAAGYVEDRRWFIQKAIAWWLRELSKHDPERATRFLHAHGAELKPFALREARKYL